MGLLSKFKQADRAFATTALVVAGAAVAGCTVLALRTNSLEKRLDTLQDASSKHAGLTLALVDKMGRMMVTENQ